MDRDEVEVHKNAKKELGQYPAILTSRLVHNVYFLHSINLDLLSQDSVSVYLLLQRKYTPKLRKTKIDITYL